MRSTLVGRDAVLEVAFASLQSTGRVLIEGPAGIGKTSLLQAMIDLATERGMLVLRCAPTETEAALPLAALADLLQSLVGELGDLPAPQQHAARSALLLEGESAPVDERALASAARAMLDAAADHSPAGLLVAIDDTAWLDPPTERALQFALRRCSAAVRVVATRRTGDRIDPRVPLELDARTPIERLSLTPLGVGPLHRLLAQRFDVSLSRPTVVRLARESGGNPLLAIELTRAALRLPRMPGPGGDLPVPASMHELVEASLATLGPDSVRAARLAALLSAPHVPDLRAAGVPADALDAIEEVGLVTVDVAGSVRFVHPVYASAVRASIPAGVRRRLHALLAESSTDRDERARHLAQCTTDADDQVAAELGEAAERVRARGAPDLAAEFYEGPAHSPSMPPGQRRFGSVRFTACSTAATTSWPLSRPTPSRATSTVTCSPRRCCCGRQSRSASTTFRSLRPRHNVPSPRRRPRPALPVGSMRISRCSSTSRGRRTNMPRRPWFCLTEKGNRQRRPTLEAPVSWAGPITRCSPPS